MKYIVIKATILVSLLAFSLSISSQSDIMRVKSRPTLVNDEANLFSVNERMELEQMLTAYDDSTSTQIAIVTTKTLNGYAPSDYAARLGEEWGVGRNEKNNGIVILIKPRIGNERGEIFIATGYGVEHILTDARVGRIIDNYMIPYLPEDYYRASKTATMVIMQMLAGEFQADPASETEDLMMTLLIAFIILAIMVYAISKKSNNNNNGSDDSSDSGRSGGGKVPTYFPPMKGGYGRSSSGGRPSGGFGGFGGGGFGGGGAGRSF